ncbi:MAG: hypothetical protein FJ038_07105 [Chloroflexi bacterium]|nr:hypothetical protein [Chloroflexota bacterium]
MSEGPGAGDPDHEDGATAPAEPGVAPPTDAPPDEPAPPPGVERPIFVVAAPQPDPVAPAEGPLFIVPAAQPALDEPAPTIEPPQPPPPPQPAEPAVPLERPPDEPAPAEPGQPATAPTWSPSTPPQDTGEAPERPRRRWRPGCFTILLVLLAALIGGGIYAYQSRLVTPRLVLDAVGLGAAEVEFLNLRDDTLRADLAPASVADAVPAGLRLAPYEVRTYRAVRPTRLAITLVGEDGMSLGTCTLDLRSRDRYQLVALPTAALVRHVGQAPGSGRNLLFAESGFCR